MLKYTSLFVVIVFCGCIENPSDTQRYQYIDVPFTYTATTVRLGTNSIPLSNVRMIGIYNGWNTNDDNTIFTRSNGVFVLTRSLPEGMPTKYKLMVNQPDGTYGSIYDMRQEGPYLTPVPDAYCPDGYGGTIAVWTNQ